MTDRIEPGCLAVTLAGPSPYDQVERVVVRVIEALSPKDVLLMLSFRATHCPECKAAAEKHLSLFGITDHWWCDFEGQNQPPIPDKFFFPARLLRRLPPPDLAGLTARKRDAQPA